MKFLLKIATSVAFFILPHLSWTQNLIPNPGFESFSSCPDGFRQLNKAHFWQEANAGTPELFHDCGFTATERPFEGEGMAGIILLCDYDNGVEYLQVELSDSLRKGQLYCFSFQIKLEENSPIAINKIGAYFSKERLYSPNWTPFRKFPQVETTAIIGAESNAWQKVEQSFEARGGERFMTFGNFYARYYLEEKQVRSNIGDWSTYYYLDNFELHAVDGECGKKFEMKPPILKSEIDWTHVVYFDVNKFTINEAERLKLEQFIKQLPARLFQPVKVVGHTDSDAGLAYNQQLSQSRVQTVVKFLNANGVRNTYLSWLGEEQPVNNNLSKTQKASNRRVEIIIERP